MSNSIHSSNSSRRIRLFRSASLLLTFAMLAAPVAVLRAQSVVSGTDPVPTGESVMPSFPIVALMILGLA